MLDLFGTEHPDRTEPARRQPAAEQATLWQTAPDPTAPAHDQVLALGAVPAWAAAILYQYQLSDNARRVVLEDIATGRITTPTACRARCRALRQAE